MDLLQILISAQKSEFGIEVQSSSAPKLRQALYPLIKEHQLPLSLHLNPANPQGLLWIRRTDVETPGDSLENITA